MAGSDPDPFGAGWTGAVLVEEEPVLAEEVRRRSAPTRGEPSVSVSDLLGPRRAFWRRRAPATPIGEDRRERMEAGRSWHSRLVAALPGEGVFEVRVRRDGIAGRIDLLAEVPVEVKTGASVGPDRLVEYRPDHVEQIAMYCALAGSPTGRIVTLSPADDGTTSVEAVDLSVPNPGAVAEAMRARAQALRTAVRDGRPGDLPACRWFGRRCEFQEAGVCDCEGKEPAPSTDILGQVARLLPRPDVADRWRAAINGPGARAELPALSRFRDLIYPRRAFFERTASPAPPESPAPVHPRPPGPDMYDRLMEAVEGGPVGEVARLAPIGAGPEEEVPGFRGAPFLVRSSRAWSRLRPDDALARFPQYALELAFRCAATGTVEGRVFLGFERAEHEADRFEVLHYRFEPIARFAQIWNARTARFQAALADGDPGSLPTCPAWMYDECSYRASCGCGPGAGRSQR
ncbi:MAG: hypothetical protein ACLQD8_05905 [Thermoplasmata archaeon]